MMLVSAGYNIQQRLKQGEKRDSYLLYGDDDLPEKIRNNLNYYINLAEEPVRWDRRLEKERIRFTSRWFGQQVPQSLFKNLRRIEKMKHLEGWQKSFIQTLLCKKETKRVYLFKENNLYNIWVVVENTPIDLMLSYSSKYTHIVKKYPEINSDFIVFNENEIKKMFVPENSKVFKKE